MTEETTEARDEAEQKAARDSALLKVLHLLVCMVAGCIVILLVNAVNIVKSW